MIYFVQSSKRRLSYSGERRLFHWWNKYQQISK
nr:MAG TPA: hypothetical protein [Caudoviricetes sp.]